MKVTFPAMRGTMGKRQFISCTIAMSEIPRLFKFNDWEQCTPELRAQRILNTSRVPDIAKYLLDNEDGYLFSSITASYADDCLAFKPSDLHSDIGVVEMELEKAEFVINDGQHRCAGIAAALKENPALGKDKISILLFPQENLARLQQMFTDLNRFAHKTSKSLDILYDHRDHLSALTMDLSEQVNVFQGMIDKEKITVPLRSPKLFTLASLYDATEELLGDGIDKPGTPAYHEKLHVAIKYWTIVSKVIDDWRKVKDGDLKASELRQEKICTHAVILRALGSIGHMLLDQYPKDWEEKIAGLKKIEWRKSIGNKVNPLWDNVCITAGSVISNRQARVETVAVLKKALEISDSEKAKQRAENKAAKAKVSA